MVDGEYLELIKNYLRRNLLKILVTDVRISEIDWQRVAQVMSTDNYTVTDASYHSETDSIHLTVEPKASIKTIKFKVANPVKNEFLGAVDVAVKSALTRR